MTLQATLVTDGASDVMLVPVLQWLMGQLTAEAFEIRWADLRGLRGKPRGSGPESWRLPSASILVNSSSCTEMQRGRTRASVTRRYAEAADTTACSHVGVVPVRMQEAWLLHDEAALREAADRPSGTGDLGLPPPHRWERLPDPKKVLHDALRAANGATGRRAKSFRPKRAAHRLAALVTDWRPLRSLAAFNRLEADTRSALEHLGLQTVEGD